MSQSEQKGEEEREMLRHDPEANVTTGWHLDKRISVAHILATLSMTAALGSVLWSLETRVTMTELNLERNSEVNQVEHLALYSQVKDVKARDIQLMNEWVRQNGDIIRRLERIEDGVNKHITESSKN